MSRRHHHHNVQSYDYDRFNDHSRDTRDRDRQAHAIEYQDDSLSSINSDDESYMHRARGSKEKKSTFYNVKSEPPPPKISKREKTPSETFKDAKVVTSEQTNTQERLGRLESMLEELIKRSIPSSPSPVPNVTDKEILDRRQNQLHLEPRRHSFTTSMWINRIQEISVQNNWNEKNTIQFMAAQMSGIIKAWYNSLPSYNFTWPELKILISKIFPDNVDFVTTLKRLVTRLKQVDEDMNTYYFSKMYLIEACKITGEDAVSCLIDGLNNQEIQEQARVRNFLTPESLYSQFLLTLHDYSVDYSPAAASASAPASDASINNWYYQNETVTHDPVTDQEFDNESRNENFNYHSQITSKFHREDEEHAANSTLKRPGVHARLDKRFIKPSFRTQNRLPMAAKICTICNGRGHLARHCRNVEKVLCCRSAIDQNHSCYFKECVINDQILDAFIDSGCTTVAVKETVAALLNLNLSPTSDVIQVYGGATVPVKGETHIVIQIDSIKASVRAVVVPDSAQDVSVVVGQGFLNQRGVTVLLKNNKLKIFKNHKTN